jgi:hypothetical protein
MWFILLSFGYFLVGRLGLGISRVGPVLVSRRDSGIGSLQYQVTLGG